MSRRDKSKHPIDKIKKGSLTRQWQIAKTGIKATTVAGTKMWGSLLLDKQQRQQRNSRILSEQAHYVVEELGKLKGAAVKIGQMMALYGEHILPEELSSALRELEEHTTALAWPVIEAQLKAQLGASFNDFLIEKEPIGAASLAQVHKAVYQPTGERVCFKVQYPGIADAIDSDIKSVTRLLFVVNFLQKDKALDAWLDEIRRLLYQEVDYQLEAEKTQHFYRLLQGHALLRVPKVYPEFSNKRLLTSSFEAGFSVSDKRCKKLSQAQRNQLGREFLSVFLQEVFIWGVLQTDPNFGNYRIRQNGEAVELVLLDFGSVMAYPKSFLRALQEVMIGTYQNDLSKIRRATIALGVMQEDYPEEVHKNFAELCFLLLEPFSRKNCPASALNDKAQYRWAHSDLPKRAAKFAAHSSLSRYFAVPPKEFAFVSRKLLGVYSFITALEAEFNPDELLEQYID